MWDRQRVSWGGMGRERSGCLWEKGRCKWLRVIWWEEGINMGPKAAGRAKKEHLSCSQYLRHWVSLKALHLPLFWCYLTFKMVNRLYNICWFTKWRHCKLTWRQSWAALGEQASGSVDFPLILHESYISGLRGECGKGEKVGCCERRKEVGEG